MTAIAIAFLVPAIGLVAACLYHGVASATERRRFPPTGELVDIGGYRLHLHRMGEGGPTVVLDSALAGSSLSWAEIQPKVAELTRVVSYDRAGFGWSDPSPTPRTVTHMVDELRRVLDAAGIEPPYVLVGHSYGGWIAQLYASTHRDQVAGLVLVDVPHPREWSDPGPAQRARVRRGARLARRAAFVSRFGWIRGFFLLGRLRLFREHGHITALLAKTPPAIRAQLKTFWVQPKTLEALASMIENAPESARRVLSERSSLGDAPLVVLTAADPDEKRLRDQLVTTALSRSGRHVVSSKSGHWIPLEDPELVVSAIRDVMHAIGERRGSTE